jgi:hypothetical protein
MLNRSKFSAWSTYIYVYAVHAYAAANRLFPLKIFPYRKNRYGKGIIDKARKPSSELAH